ncbi:MAG TPA: cytochrome c3 family protein [Burkholderiaceae bacterium]|nr:cytochrome c3 family protein [Burkholderiaceae bacterium]
MQAPSSLRPLVIAAMAAVLLTVSMAVEAADAAPNDTCLMCHGDPGAKSDAGKSIAVDAKKFGTSVHGQMNFKCTDCHSDVSADKLPHEAKLKPANCGACHEAAVTAYQSTAHAKARAGGNMVAATCSDCHGSHDILKSSDPASRTNIAKREATCGTCHGNEAVIQKAKLPGGNIVAQYHDSIHGRKTNGGTPDAAKAPTCTGCHGAHSIRSKGDATSRVNRDNIAQMCGSCHQQVYSRFSASQHGQMRQAGNSAAPTCIDCHSAHRIQPHGSPQWQVDVINECGNCHQDFITSYRDTYHGQVTKLGYTRVATCNSCHGAHEVLPASNPKSMVSPENRVNTCRSCHPGANANFAAYEPHGNPHDRAGNPILYYTRLFMQLLLAGVFTFFGIHTLLWLIRSLKDVDSRRGGGGSH